jgi:hypothetical protein
MVEVMIAFAGCAVSVFFLGMIWTDFACKTYFEHKMKHFQQISSEMNTKFRSAKQGEHDA